MRSSIASTASAWFSVRGYPSRMKPSAQSAWSIRSETIALTMSSETRLPESITALAFSPTSDWAVTAARSMSPVESCGILCVSIRRCAWVPFPAPGGPNNISLIWPPVFHP